MSIAHTQLDFQYFGVSEKWAKRLSAVYGFIISFFIYFSAIVMNLMIQILMKVSSSVGVGKGKK